MSPDPGHLRGPFQLPPDSGVGIRQAPDLHRTREEPIVFRPKLCQQSPGLQMCEELFRQLDRARPVLRLRNIDVSFDDRSVDRYLPVKPIDIRQRSEPRVGRSGRNLGARGACSQEE
jgi:hypothetical protein